MVLSKQVNQCHYCQKVFCCSDCLKTHKKTKHPEPKCMFCMNSNLVFHPNVLIDSQEKSNLLCHIVFNHLPLRCKLCGEKFTNLDQLINTRVCKYWSSTVHKRLQAKILSNGVIIINNTENIDNKIKEKLSSTPQSQSEKNIKKPNFNIDVNLIARLKQDKFESSVTLARHSTPMHGVALPGQKQPVVSAVSQFVLKTPSSAEKATFESTDSAFSRNSVSSSCESRYYTGTSLGIDAHLERINLEGLKRANQVDNMSENQSEACDSPTYSILKKQLEQENVKFDALERVTQVNDSSRETVEKRVRFSDQCAPVIQDVDQNKDNSIYAEDDIFFEARESLDEEPNEQVLQKTESCSPCSSTSKAVINRNDSPVSSSSNTNNINNSNDIKEEKNIQTSGDSGESKSSSSRVLMMLLVEKSDSKGLSSLDLGSIIDSGLRKLEENISIKPADTGKSSSDKTESTTKFTAEISEFERKVSSLKDTRGKRTSIKDSFVRISDKVECYTGPTPVKQSQETSKASSEEQPVSDKAVVPADSYKSDGIFSVVARVVRSALKKLPAVGSVTSRTLSREPISSSDSIVPKLESTATLDINSTHVLALGSSCAAAASTRYIIQRSASKRPRDRSDSNEDLRESPVPQESPGSSGSNGSPRTEVVYSPAAKRQRGWYRIRAREPIARMRERQLTSPRGVSFETQRFQQGSLIIGDTHLPLPSRAHQFTQTEEHRET